MNVQFYSPGKLLLTGEYFVLDQAQALALPTRFGQHLKIQPGSNDGLHWRSLDSQGSCWFEGLFTQDQDGWQSAIQDDVSLTLLKTIKKAQQLNPVFLTDGFRIEATATLEFARDWGLGSSATLINNISQWAKVNPYVLNEAVFGGSGYDIATAQHQSAVLYQKTEAGPIVREVAIVWPFTDALFFVHLNQKQDSRQGIAQFNQTPDLTKEATARISSIGEAILQCQALSDFEQLLIEHETLVSERIELPTVQASRFPDYPGVVKSLGAWGGDFVLATGGSENHSYFLNRGFTTLLPFDEMIAKKNPVRPGF